MASMELVSQTAKQQLFLTLSPSFPVGGLNIQAGNSPAMSVSFPSFLWWLPALLHPHALLLLPKQLLEVDERMDGKLGGFMTLKAALPSFLRFLPVRTTCMARTDQSFISLTFSLSLPGPAGV